MPKDSIKDKVDGNELDMSMNDLTSIPVKDLVTVKQATRLDFSCNLLTSIPPEFCSLTHIVKLDLSKNKISKLPDNFGSLNKLQHLDLFENNLEEIPVGFCHLKNLKWLDLKDNPLKEMFSKAAGDCLDENQCRQCAKQIISLMKSIQSEQERRRQKQLQIEREKEAQKKVEEEKERVKKKEEKKAEKDRKRKEYEALRAKELQQNPEKETNARKGAGEGASKTTNGKDIKIKGKEKAGLSCCGVFLAFLIGLFALSVGLYFYCDQNSKDPFCKEGKRHLLNYYAVSKDWVTDNVKKINTLIQSKK